ncbi:unnamed protein product [Cercopithifilaria johnstoni]|uniref:Ribosome biogenesis protein NOP53 n=1 Tax=Cercopithifilaria johnstoni TaxID=2874296 RepID=A0A8J2M5R2_9BILA|nr:unnamed protein product [Cercopithifilaria johnstoni]
MNGNVNPSGKVRRCRISRNKKRYWKKGTEIQDAEDFLCGIQSDAIKEVEENVSKRHLRKSLLKKSKMPVKTKASSSESTAIEDRKPYDLWGPHLQKEMSVAENYYLLTTKKKPPKEPRTLRHIASILQHVEIAPTGASYNPPVSKYLDYVTGVAEEEKKKIKESEKLERELALLKGKCATQEEIELELRAGLDGGDDYDDEILIDENEIEQNDCGEKRPIIKRKKKKTRYLEYMERKRKETENISAFQKEQMHLIYSARKLNKEISKEIQKRMEFAKKRKEHKLMKKFAGTQRLGRGKFEPCEEPVLLTEELPGSLRELKPQGSILTERLKSLQKRNMLSIPGEKRHRRKLKNKLRIKEREDRKHQEVKLGTHLI